MLDVHSAEEKNERIKKSEKCMKCKGISIEKLNTGYEIALIVMYFFLYREKSLLNKIKYSIHYIWL